MEAEQRGTGAGGIATFFSEWNYDVRVPDDGVGPYAAIREGYVPLRFRSLGGGVMFSGGTVAGENVETDRLGFFEFINELNSVTMATFYFVAERNLLVYTAWIPMPCMEDALKVFVERLHDDVEKLFQPGPHGQFESAELTASAMFYLL